MESTLFIPAYNWTTLTEKIAKLNKKSTKLGCAPVGVVKTGKTDTLEIKEGNKVVEIVNLIEVTVHGEPPKLEGWTLLGVIEFNKNYPAPIIREVPGRIVPKKYRKATTTCDHCKSARYRNEVFIVDNGTKTKQVGRQCLADFLGHQSPEHFLAYASFLRNLEELIGEASDPDDCWGCRDANPCWPVDYVLAVAHKIIGKYGFVSKTRAEETCSCSTAGEVFDYLLNRYKDRDAERLAKHDPTTDDYKIAKRVIKWMKGIPASEESNYLHTLRMVGHAGVVDRTTMGITASAFTAYLKANELLEKKAGKKPSGHVGTIGKREKFEVKFLSVFWADTFYGPLAIVRLLDRNGNTLVWKTHQLASQFDHAAAAGYVDGKTQVNIWYTIKATPKEHGEFRGEKQTVLQRVVVEETKEEREKIPAKKAA